MPSKFTASAVDLLRALVPAAFVLSLTAAPLLAQTPQEGAPAEQAEAISPDTVLASVGGSQITEADLLLAAEELTAEMQSIPADQRRAFLLTVLIDMKLMAGAAREDGLADTDEFARRLAYLEDQALRRAFFNQIVETAVTDEAIEAAYDELAAEFTPEPEVRARHILVETREQADDIRAEIEGGLSFEDAAAQYGTDGTSATGGDLGYFGTGMMVPEFEEAAFALEVGELSQPVQSQFGWHLIKLEDRRLAEAPPLAEVRQQVAQQVLYDSYEAAIEAIRQDVEIVIDDEDLAAAIEAQGGI